MNNISYMIGKKKAVYDLYIKIYVFLHFSFQILTGKFPGKNYMRFLKRLLFFLSKMKGNKYVKSNGFTKINLYVPAFPSKAFFKACRKVIVSEEKMPSITVLLSITSACRYKCEHCYQKHDKGKDVEIELLCEVTSKLDKMGVSFFNIEGGEPFLLFDRLKKVCQSISVGEIWINSTGDGMTPEKLAELKTIGVKGIMFSLHSDKPEEINSFFGKDNGWDNLKNGIEMCHHAGLDVAANTCIMKADYYNGKFQSIVDLAKELGVSIIQLIKPKPSGAWLDKKLDDFTQDDLKYIEKLVFDYNNKNEFKKYPFIAAQISEERSDMFGCTAGGTDRFYINAKGDVQPCEFLNISFGNIKEEPFENIYDRMRHEFHIPGDKWLCEEYAKDIHRIVVENDIKTFPLSVELSKQVIDNWERGKPSEFYEGVVKK
jgi:MoaA/NifB/PqqE/SkfB family radical SAM enzyme